MGKIRISAVKYANTYPFIWGLKESGFDKKVIIETDHPSQCASKLINFKVDIGLVPVAALLQVKDYKIISDYCIGTNGKVRTVMLLSNSPFEEVETINLDYRSVSSVNLARILAKNMWKREFKWADTTEQFDFVNPGTNEAVVLIGDQCFKSESKFRFRIDLAEEWKKHTGLPFVFACWASNRNLESSFIEEFSNALKLGVENIDKVARAYANSIAINEDELEWYLKYNIDFILNEEKRKGMDLFLDLLKKL
jgi:chorismate dehydratase